MINVTHFNNRQLTLVTDRSQGGSSIKDGSLEVMLHRRTLYDDALGVSEPIDEKGKDGRGLVVRGKINMIFDSVSNSAALHRELAHRINNGPLILVTSEESLKSVDVAGNGLITQWRGLRDAMPANLHLLTLMKDFDSDDEILNSIIVRIEHFYEKNEDPVLSLPATINLLDLLGAQFNITNVQELALGANMKVSELNERLRWTAEDLTANLEHSVVREHGPRDDLKNAFNFQFNPMQIRTFRVWYLPRGQDSRLFFNIFF
jgi:lysosomal alpha-mannosidase